MSTSAIPVTSLTCLERTQRADPMRRKGAMIPAKHATEFRQGMHEFATAEADDSLEKGQLRLLPARELSVLCVTGELWITRDGDVEDYILGPGQQLAIGRHDQAAVQALQASRFRLIRA